MSKLIPWSDDEDYVLESYFKGSVKEMSAYERIHAINPHRTYEAMMRRIRLLRSQGWSCSKWQARAALRVGYLDIEATNLDANFGMMLSWYIKTQGKNEYRYGVITKDEIFDEKFDRRIMEELLDALSHYDVLWTHYGSDRRFDVPFIRTRAYRHGLEAKLPHYMEKFIMDTYPIARNKLRLHSNRLDSIADALQIRGVKKTPLSPQKWELAKVGNKGALEYVAKHNKRDVQLLERVHAKLALIDRPIYRSM